MTRMKQAAYRRFVAMLLALMMLVMSTPMLVYAVGINENGYIEIRTVEELDAVRNDLTANYILMNDIDLSEATQKGGKLDFLGNGWNPIGSNNVYGNKKFAGVFDGNGHKITGLRIDVTSIPSGTGSSRYIGLFSYVSGTVKNLTVSGSVRYASDKQCYLGAVAGYCSGTISGCVNNASVHGAMSHRQDTGYVGGICGFASGVVTLCANNGQVSSHSSISDMYTSGVVGRASTVSMCYNTGSVSAVAQGENGSYAHAYASGISYEGSITDCYNTASVESIISGNGHAGYSYTFAYGIGGNPKRCYNLGNVSGQKAQMAINSVGASKCYYLNGVGGGISGAASMTDTQAKTQAMYGGFDFEKVWIQNPYAVYPYPQLIANPQNLEEVVSAVCVATLPQKTEYLEGDELVSNGCTIEVTYASGRTELLDATVEMMSGFNGTIIGEQTINVTYRGLSDHFQVSVLKKLLAGTVISYGDPDTEATVKLFRDDEEITCVPTTDGNYVITSVEPGDYVIVVSKTNHVDRSYAVIITGETVTQDAKIHLLGDVNLDGKVNSGDVAKLYSHLRRTNMLTDDYQLLCANVNGGKLNMGDAASLYSHIRKTRLLY